MIFSTKKIYLKRIDIYEFNREVLIKLTTSSPKDCKDFHLRKLGASFVIFRWH